MLTIQTSKATVLAVRLPKGAEVKNCIKYEDVDFLFYQMPIIRGMSSMALPIGSWQPIGFANMISESDMDRIVDSSVVDYDGYGDPETIYKDYNCNYENTVTWYSVLSDSFKSLLAKHGISEEHYLLIKID